MEEFWQGALNPSPSPPPAQWRSHCRWRCALCGATAPLSKPRRATARLHLGRSSVEALHGTRRVPWLAPQDDGTVSVGGDSPKVRPAIAMELARRTHSEI